MYTLSFDDITFNPRCTEWRQKVFLWISPKLWKIEALFVLWAKRKSFMPFHLTLSHLNPQVLNDPKRHFQWSDVLLTSHISPKISEIEAWFVLWQYRKLCMPFHLTISRLSQMYRMTQNPPYGNLWAPGPC